jgi:hypothetical protein
VGCGLLLLLAACTNDFSRFKFKDAPTSQSGSGGSQLPLRDAGTDAKGMFEIDGGSMNPRKDSGSNTGKPEGGKGSEMNRDSGGHESSSNAGTGMPQPMNDSGLPHDADSDDDADTPPDAQLPDAQAEAGMETPDTGTVHEDAATQEVLECTTAIMNEQAPDACTNCSCAKCTNTVLDCLTRGNAYDNDLCKAVYLCAVRARCHDWDCYCRDNDQSCRRNPTAPGNGPCTDEMNMAAGGDRQAVETAHIEKKASNPLVRALHAVQCTLGAPMDAIDGMVMPQCDSTDCPPAPAAVPEIIQ